MKKILSLTLVLVASLSFGQGVSLDELIARAKDHHPQNQQLALIEELTDLQVKQLAGAYLPQSSLGGQATWQSEVTSIDISLPGVSILPPPKDQYKLTLDVQQNLWDGGLTSAQKAMAKSNGEVEKARLNTDIYKIEEQLTQLYFGVLFADKQKANVQVLLAEINKKMNTLQAAVDNGVAVKSDLLAIKAKKIELQQQLAEIEKKKEAALEGIYLLTGQKVSPIEEFEAPVNPMVEFANNTRPELSFLSAQQKALSASEKLIKAKNLPKLVLFGTGGYGRPGLNFLARDFSPYFIGGLQLKIPLSYLYNGGQTNDLQQVKVNALRLEKQKQSFLLASNVQLATQQKELERLEGLIESDDQLIAIREQIRMVADAQLENGIVTATDYLEKLDQEDLAKKSKIIHEVQLLQTQRNIKLLLGQ